MIKCKNCGYLMTTWFILCCTCGSFCSRDCMRIYHKEADITSKCILCKKSYSGYGNNVEPLAKGFCYDKCNIKVIVARLKALKC